MKIGGHHHSGTLLASFKKWCLIWEVAGSRVYLTSIAPGLLVGVLIWWMKYGGNDILAKFQSISAFVLVTAGMALIAGCLAHPGARNKNNLSSSQAEVVPLRS